jgi:hypothetical protein
MFALCLIVLLAASAGLLAAVGVGPLFEVVGVAVAVALAALALIGLVDKRRSERLTGRGGYPGYWPTNYGGAMYEYYRAGIRVVRGWASRLRH